ncbi:MAG: DUF1217 domain-containing protein [Alphaproteobacteria bacterium]|nr:DUF1217 domain-containing protein [Alphaproteobacteria bacterium]
MDIQASSLALILGQNNQNSLLNAVTKKATVSPKLAHQSMTVKEVEQRDILSQKDSIERSFRAFNKALENANSVEDALADPDIHRMLNQVYEIKILSGNHERFAKVAASDPDDPNSESSRSRDRGLIKLAQDIQKSGDGLGLLKDKDFQEGLRDVLVSIDFEANAREVNPAAADAFYFERKSVDINNAWDILSSGKVRDVVFGALNIPDQYKSRPLQEQVALLDSKLDYDKFKDISYVKQLSVDHLTRLEYSQPSGKPNPMAILNTGRGTGALFDLMS